MEDDATPPGRPTRPVPGYESLATDQPDPKDVPVTELVDVEADVMDVDSPKQRLVRSIQEGEKALAQLEILYVVLGSRDHLFCHVDIPACYCCFC